MSTPCRCFYPLVTTKMSWGKGTLGNIRRVWASICNYENKMVFLEETTLRKTIEFLFITTAPEKSRPYQLTLHVLNKNKIIVP